MRLAYYRSIERDRLSRASESDDLRTDSEASGKMPV